MFLKSSLLGPQIVRTKEQQMEVAMLDDVKAALARSPATLVEDLAGVVTLFALLVAGLHLPLFS
jgi:hypothetical protein